MEEVELSNVGDVLTDNDLPDLILICRPGRTICLVVPHSAAAGDLQYTCRVQRPGGIFAAGTGGNHRRLGGSCHIGNAVFLGIALGIGVLGHKQGHALHRILEDPPSDTAHSVGNVQVLQLCICSEHAFTHAGQAAVFTDLHAG